MQSDFASLAALSPTAMLLLDRVGQVHYANPAAEALLARIEMLSLKAGTLVARRKEEDKVLRDALAALTPSRASSVLCLRNRESLPMVVVDLALLASGLLAGSITEMIARPAPSPARLKAIFGLTGAECRVALAMLSGLGISAVARENGVEPETVRSQAKRIRAKTGARSQNQMLGALAAAGADMVPPGVA